MKINLSKLTIGKTNLIEIDFDFRFENEDLLKKYDIVNTTPFKVKGKIFKATDKIYLYLIFIGSVTFNCNRCISNFTKEISGELNYEVIIDEENKLDIDNEDDIIYTNDNILDLSKILTDSIVLSIPMKVICSEECRGLCPVCGKDLNSESCTCDEDNIDPRLEKLKQFFTENEEV